MGFQNVNGNVLQRVSILGGTPATICELPAKLRGASWGPDDGIVFAVNAPGLWRVPAAGGEPTPLIKPDDFYWFPDVLPNGAGVLFTYYPSTSSSGQIAVLDLATHQHRVIVESGSFPRYADSGHIVYGVRGASEDFDHPQSVTPDGRAVAFFRMPVGDPTQWEIWEVAVDGGESPVPLLQGARYEDAEYSPDGNWLAYRSDQSGAWEVYVQPYPGPGPVVPVSIGGGDDASRSVDGSRLFYRLGDRMEAVAFEPGDPAQIGSPTTVFDRQYSARLGGPQYDVAPDGRFLEMSAAAADGREGPMAPQVVLIQNWLAELTERVPIP